MSTQLRIRYVPDNNRITGFGGLLKGPGTKGVANAVSDALAIMIAIEAIKAEGRDPYLVPGRVVQVYSKIKHKNFMKPLGVHRNLRWAARLEVTGSYEGEGGNRVKSSPVTIEFGSDYNEGTPGDRPRQRIMGKAIKRLSTSLPGIDLGSKGIRL